MTVRSLEEKELVLLTWVGDGYVTLQLMRAEDVTEKMQKWFDKLDAGKHEALSCKDDFLDFLDDTSVWLAEVVTEGGALKMPKGSSVTRMYTFHEPY